MKFSDVPDDCYFVVIKPDEASPVLYKTPKESELKLQIGFLQCHKPIDSSDFDIAPDTEVQLIAI